MHTRASNSELVEPLPEPESTLNRRLHRRNRRVPFEQRNNPPQHPRIVYPLNLNINYFHHFLAILRNYDPMDDEPIDDEDVEPTPQPKPKTPTPVKETPNQPKNMLVEVGKFTFPADFVILEMEEDSKVPLISGRPFLHTADAVIRVKQKQLNL
ncbi:reverse transcriptase domain-containing protein [Tanacetum coccineum]